jgi:hypothetical protein
MGGSSGGRMGIPVERCQRACEVLRECQSFTFFYHPPSELENNATCILKSDIPEQQQEPFAPAFQRRFAGLKGMSHF